MKEENIIQEKSYAFAVRIIRLCQFLTEKKKEFVLSKQILRSGTSIGANIEEAIGGQSRPDFISKINIAYKEARETSYWLRLLKDTDFISPTEFDSIHADVYELRKIMGAILKTSKSNPA